MAFNPFTSFRKYQKAWMATVLLLCMVTFVLCTGVGGDLSDRLLSGLRPRGGNAAVELDGRTIYSNELYSLKTQRKLADKYMRLAIERVVDKIDKNLKQAEREEGKANLAQRKLILARLASIKADLKQRVDKPRYFEGDFKFDALVDFMVWLKQADRLEISLTQDSIWEMILMEVFGRVGELFTRHDSFLVRMELRRDVPGITDAYILKALGDEFRVRIAQVASYLAQTDTYRKRYSPIRAELQEHQLLKYKEAVEVRAPLTPAQMWDIYRDKRTQYDLGLVPVQVDYFRDKIKDPDTDKLKSFFEANKAVPYDPSSPQPGFEIPQLVKLAWLMADPASDAYKRPAEAVSLLEMTPPVACLGPFEALANAVRFGASPLAWDASMEQHYAKLRSETFKELPLRRLLALEDPAKNYFAAPLTEDGLPSLVGYLGKPSPEAVASAVGSAGFSPLAAFGGYRAQVYERLKSQLGPVLAEENKPRVQLAADMVSLGSASPFFSVAAWSWADHPLNMRFLPLEAVKKELKERREEVLAKSWTSANMMAVKDVLEPLAGKDRAIDLRVPKLIEQYGLQHGVTKKFYNRFDIDQAPELAAFHPAFAKYRVELNISKGTAGTPQMLKEGDFYKLFFEGGDAGSGRYVVRPWPNNVFFETSGKPILYWKTEDKQQRPAESLAEVKELVLSAWKTEKARDELVLPRAKEIALALQKSGGEFAPVIRVEATKLETEPIFIRGLAALDPDNSVGSQRYREFPLPDNTFKLPRDDMVKQLLALTAMDKIDKPLKSDYKDKDGKDQTFKALDDLNKELFDITRKLPEKERAGKFVQVLTNKPHTAFWVAAVVAVPGADMNAFAEAYKKATSLFGPPPDAFITLAQEETARQYRQALLQQLRDEMKLKIVGDKEREAFDKGD